MRSSTTQDGSRSRLMVAGTTILMLGAGSYWLWSTPVESDAVVVVTSAGRRERPPTPTVKRMDRPTRNREPATKPVTERRPPRKPLGHRNTNRRPQGGRRPERRPVVLAPAG